jgi:Fe-S cluster biogenesis protein NfuA
MSLVSVTSLSDRLSSATFRFLGADRGAVQRRWYIPAVPLQRQSQEGTACAERFKKSSGQMRPAVQVGGGDIELVDIEDGVVKPMLPRACVGCLSFLMTLEVGIEQILIDAIPEVTEVVAL